MNIICDWIQPRWEEIPLPQSKESEPLYALDLFSGCGGLSEGFIQADIDVVAHVEKNPRACMTLVTRCLYHDLKEIDQLDIYHEYQKHGDRDKFFSQYSSATGNPIEVDEEENCLEQGDGIRIGHRLILPVEITDDNYERVERRLKQHLQEHPEIPEYHVVLGGPPCQAYSKIGRARDVDGMDGDHRHHLYRFYLSVLRDFSPKAFFFENVPGLLTAASEKKEMFTQILNDLETLNPPYYLLSPNLEVNRQITIEDAVEEDSTKLFNSPDDFIINSFDFGVPQKRKRIFMIGWLKDGLPSANFHMDFSSNLEAEMEQGPTVGDAIGDLPVLEPPERSGDSSELSYPPEERNKPERGDDHWFDVSPSDDQSEYVQKLREHTAPGGINNHCARGHWDMDRKRYRAFIEYGRKFTSNGKAENITLEDLREINQELLPDHKNLEGFLDRFKVQFRDSPSYTITKHISKDGHYYIHPDKSQARSFTVREAARCQSFPDDFIFEGPRTEQYKQVGNAVPPLLAEKLARAIKPVLSLAESTTVKHGS